MLGIWCTVIHVLPEEKHISVSDGDYLNLRIDLLTHMILLYYLNFFIISIVNLN